MKLTFEHELQGNDCGILLRQWCNFKLVRYVVWNYSKLFYN